MAPEAPKYRLEPGRKICATFQKMSIFLRSRKASIDSLIASYIWDPFWDPSAIMLTFWNEADATRLRGFDAFSRTNRHQTTHKRAQVI